MEASTANILVLEAFDKVTGSIFLDPSTISNSISFPKFPPDVLLTLIDLALTRFQKQPSVIDVPLGTYVIGDIHGNVHDLLRILGTIGDFLPKKNLQEKNSTDLLSSDENENMPDKNQTKLLFLGNYIDQGQFSLEVITLLFALTVTYPDNFYLLRGNHEFKEVNEQYGFKSEIISEYGRKNDICDRFNKAFSYMPLAAVVGNSNICIHGGLSSKLSMISQVQSIQRPLRNCENIMVNDLMWSNPSTDTMTFKASYDGKGCFFGQQSTSLFLKNNQFIRLIRGHQEIANGVQSFFKGLVFTIYSCSNPEYQTTVGFIRISLKNKVLVYNLPQSTETYDRSKTIFQPVLDEVQMTFSNVLKLKYFTYQANDDINDKENSNDKKSRTTFKCCKTDFLLYPPLSSTTDSLKRKRSFGNVPSNKASTLPAGFGLDDSQRKTKSNLSSFSMAKLPKRVNASSLNRFLIKDLHSASAKLPMLQG